MALKGAGISCPLLFFYFNLIYMKKHYTTTIIVLVLSFGAQFITAQCGTSSTVYAFDYDGRTYEVVKENKSWTDAAACAVMRGGKLAEINNAAENTAIFNALSNDAGITLSSTSTSNGGGASYVWIGGNDITTEGSWIWDGDNKDTSTPFWSGTKAGTSVNSLYNNWGETNAQNEPDNYMPSPSSPDQDGLAIALNAWPTAAPSGFGLGTAGQWNDIDASQTLYYIVEHNKTLSHETFTPDSIKVYVSKSNELFVDAQNLILESIEIFDVTGAKIITTAATSLKQNKMDISEFNKGVYLVRIITSSGDSTIRKILK